MVFPNLVTPPQHFSALLDPTVVGWRVELEAKKVKVTGCNKNNFLKTKMK